MNFGAPGVAVGIEKLLINRAAKRSNKHQTNIKQTSNKQRSAARINFVCLFVSDKLSEPAN